jgi:ankyrin repeat protein
MRKKNQEAILVLLDAIDRHNVSYVKTLLTMDFDLNDTNEHGVTPLMRAAQRGEFKMVQMFIKRGASPFIVGPSGKASEVALQNNFPAINEFLRRVEEVQAAEAAKRAAAASKPEQAPA